MWLTDLRNQTQPATQIKEVVPIIQEQFPKYDATLHSKVERPESYGIQLCPKAAKSVKAFFANTVQTAPKAPVKEHRQMPCKIVIRFTEAEYERLQTARKDAGYSTTQEWGHQLILRHLNRKEKSRKENLRND